jgi:rod shape-determining protein MreC
MLTHNRFDRSTLLFVAVLVLSFVLTTLDVRSSGQGLGETMREITQDVFTPVQKGAAAVTRPVVGFFDGIADFASLRAENEELRAEVEQLEQQIAETEQLRARLEELEKINDLAAPAGIDTVTARVIAVGVSDFDHIRRIDRGLADGITVGMAVIDEGGLVGRIVEPVNEHSATIRLITDPLSTVGVRVLSTGEAGWVTGQGAGPLVLKMARASHEIAAGDLLETGGGRFPAGIIVGAVAEGASAEAGFLLTTTAEPRVHFDRLDFVKVLITNEGDEPIEDVVEEDRIPVEEDPATPAGGEGSTDGEPGGGDEPAGDEPGAGDDSAP